jgi:hypothetical protein
MPPTGTRVTLKMQCDTYGISETHVMLTSTNFDTVTLAATALMKARMALSGFPTVPNSIRMSKIGSPRVYRVIGASDLAGLAPIETNLKTSDGNLSSNDSDQPRSCLLLSASNSDTLHKKIYLAGIPDVIIGEPNPGGKITLNAWWLPLYNKYKNLLIGTATAPTVWGFVARTLTTVVNYGQYPVVAVSQQAGTNLFGVAVAGTPALITTGSPIQLLGFKRSNNAYAPANGVWYVQSVVQNLPANGFTTYYLLNSTQVNPAILTKLGTIQLVDYTSYAYNNLSIGQDTTRKRGGSFLASRGRRTIRKYVRI